MGGGPGGSRQHFGAERNVGSAQLPWTPAAILSLSSLWGQTVLFCGPQHSEAPCQTLQGIQGQTSRGREAALTVPSGKCNIHSDPVSKLHDAR